MDLEAVAGSQDLMLSQTPAHSDRDLASTRVAAPVDQELATGDQGYGASSITSDESDVPSKAVPSSTRPSGAPKHGRFRFLVTTSPNQFKNKAMMRENRKHVKNDFLRRERGTPRTQAITGDESVELKKPESLDSYQRKATTPKDLAAPVRKLDAVAVELAGMNLRPTSWIREWIDGSAVSPERHREEETARLMLLVTTGNLDKLIVTATVEDSVPAAIPTSSGMSVGTRNLKARMDQNEKSQRATQPNDLERYTTQPMDNTVLACEPTVEQSLATEKGLLAVAQLDLQTIRATPEPAGQDRVQNNPFQQRLQKLVQYLALEGESSPDSASSITDSDSAISSSGHLTGNRCHNAAPNSDNPQSSNEIPSNKQHTLGGTSQTPYNRSGGTSRSILGLGPTREHGNNERVQIDACQSQNDQESGKVIPCPLRLELKCAGKDDNMSSLLRELSNSTHNIFYCNRCKSLLSRIAHFDNAESLRRLRKESKERWQVHLKTCHDDHCVMPACAPQPHGEVRHKHNENCKTNREDEKEADANYLCRQLGVAELGIENGIKTAHGGKRRSTARKIVRVAEDAVQSNVELESKIDELCSIIRHALEDMKRENVNLTNALHDRIRRHAPSALRSYVINTPPCMSPILFAQDPPYADSSLSHAHAGTPYKRTNALNAVSSIVNGTDLRKYPPTDTTSSLQGPAAKRRRGGAAPFDEHWDYSNPTTYLPGSERSGPIHSRNDADPAGPTMGALAYKTASDQTTVAAEASSHQLSRLDSISLQIDGQQASAEVYNDTTQYIGRTVFGEDVRPDNPVYMVESFPRCDIADPLFPHLTSGQQRHSTQSQLSWMNFDQGMMGSDLFGTNSESQLWQDHFDRSV